MKNAIIFSMPSAITSSAQTIEEALQTQVFVPCGATQEISTGWIPPRGHENGALLESVGGQWILKLIT